MADAKLTALTAASALAAADLFYVSQSAASRKATGTQLLALVGTTYVPLAGGTMTGALTIASGTLTASAPALNITQTLNANAAFTVAKTNVTITLSNGSALLHDWQVAGASMVALREDGAVIAAGRMYGSSVSLTAGTGLWTANTIMMPSTGYFSIGDGTNTNTATPDVRLYRDAAATLAQRNGTTQQIFRLYNTTDAGLTNYERLTLTGVAGTSVNITAETLGTGGDNLDIVLTPAGTGKVRLPDGLSTQLALAFTTTATTGIFAAVSGTRFGIVSNGTFSLNIASNFVAMPTASVLGWTSVGGADGSSIAAGLAYNAAGVVEVNNGTAGAYRDLKLRNLIAGGGNGSYVQTPSMTVASLAAAATAGAGARAFVTDATATTFLSTVAGGGSNKVPVVSDGTNWLIG